MDIYKKLRLPEEVESRLIFRLAITNRVKRGKQHLYTSSPKTIQLLSGFHAVSCINHIAF